MRDVFRLARENAPAVIFIDEVDAIATKRFDAQTGADREVQRILMELLTQMDGFDQSVNVKVPPLRPSMARCASHAKIPAPLSNGARARAWHPARVHDALIPSLSTRSRSGLVPR